MSIKFSDKPGEHDAGAIMEVAPMIGLDNLTDNVQGSYHNISSDNIPLWNVGLGTVSGDLGIVGLTKTVLEVEGMSEGGATYLSTVLSLGSYGLTAYKSASHR
jgi:hypothetical protein